MLITTITIYLYLYYICRAITIFIIKIISIRKNESDFPAYSANIYLYRPTTYGLNIYLVLFKTKLQNIMQILCIADNNNNKFSYFVRGDIGDIS